MSYLKIIIKERLNEISKTVHSVDRVKSRLHKISNEINPSHYNIIVKSLEEIRNIDFPEDKSFAINMGPMVPNKDSKHIYKIDNRIYFRIIGLDDGVFKDSTGNQFWVIIRNNTIVTAFLRKDIQTRDINYNRGKLNVDKVFNRVSHIKNL